MYKDDENKTKLKNLLYGFIYIESEIEDVSEKIKNFGELVNSQRDVKVSKLTGMPKGNEISDTVYNSVEKIMVTYGQEITRLEAKLENAFAKRNHILALLNVLEPVERQVVELKFFKKRKIWMIAGVVNYSERQVKRYLSSSLNKMLEVLETSGLPN